MSTLKDQKGILPDLMLIRWWFDGIFAKVNSSEAKKIRRQEIIKFAFQSSTGDDSLALDVEN